jgi:hypothetical protein
MDRLGLTRQAGRYLRNWREPGKLTLNGHLILITAVFALAGCVGYDQTGYAASPPYYYAPAPNYYAPAPAYRYGPSVGLGFRFGGSDNWHHHGWRPHHRGWHHHHHHRR